MSTELAIDYRWTEGHNDRLSAFATDLVRRQVAVIVAITTPSVLAAMRLAKKPDHRQGWLLGTRRERPCDRRAADQRDESAPFHSITSSARAVTATGKVIPNAVALFRLIAK